MFINSFFFVVGLGTYTNGIERTSLFDCKDDCGAGSYIIEDRSSCQNCDVGQYQYQNDQS